MTKRQKFVGTSILLAVFFLILHFLSISASFTVGYEIIAGSTVAALILSMWALRDGLKLNATVLTLVLPGLFTLGTSLFYFYLLLPSSFVAKLPQLLVYTMGILYWFMYAVGMYASILGSNIYTVAAIRTIALLRTAHAVGFLVTVITAFFLFDTLWSFRSFPWVNAGGALIIAFPIALQSLWSVELEEKLSKQLLLFSAIIALVMGEITLMLSFWPVTVTVASLFLTTLLYILIGVTQASIQGRLFAKTLREYLFVGSVVFVAVYFSAKWGG